MQCEGFPGLPIFPIIFIKLINWTRASVGEKNKNGSSKIIALNISTMINDGLNSVQDSNRNLFHFIKYVELFRTRRYIPFYPLIQILLKQLIYWKQLGEDIFYKTFKICRERLCASILYLLYLVLIVIWQCTKPNPVVPLSYAPLLWFQKHRTCQRPVSEQRIFAIDLT